MTDFDIFLDTHDACQDGRQRLAAAGITTFRDAYDRAAPQDLIWVLTRPGVLSQHDSVRLALHCVETVHDQLTDERSRAVIPLLHRWLDDPSTVTRDELAAADSAASDAASSAWDAASSAHATASAVWAADSAAYATASASWAAASAVADASWAARAASAAWAARNAWDAYVAASSAWTARDEPDAWIRENIPFETLHTN